MNNGNDGQAKPSSSCQLRVEAMDEWKVLYLVALIQEDAESGFTTYFYSCLPTLVLPGSCTSLTLRRPTCTPLRV